MKKILLVLILMMLVLIIGCSTQNTPLQPTPAPTQASVQPAPPATVNSGVKKDIEISNFAFNLETLTITKGTTVTWTNADSVPHTIVSDAGDELSSESLSRTQTYTHTFNNVGTYGYYCSIHPSMKGTIIVQ